MDMKKNITESQQDTIDSLSKMQKVKLTFAVGKIYNEDLCKHCKAVAIIKVRQSKRGGVINTEGYCETCKDKVRQRLKEIIGE